MDWFYTVTLILAYRHICIYIYIYVYTYISDPLGLDVRHALRKISCDMWLALEINAQMKSTYLVLVSGFVVQGFRFRIWGLRLRIRF